MDAMHVPLTAAALLLVLSGLGKLARPDVTADVLSTVGAPTPELPVRSLGAVELVAGGGVLLDADHAVWPLLAAILYTAFAGFLLVVLWREPQVSSCGCFSGARVAPSPLHVGIDVGLAAVAAITAVDHVRAPLDVVRDGGGDAVALVVASIALAALLYAVFTRPLGIRATSSIRQPR
jgi:hypothetical protein